MKCTLVMMRRNAKRRIVESLVVEKAAIARNVPDNKVIRVVEDEDEDEDEGGVEIGTTMRHSRRSHPKTGSHKGSINLSHTLLVNRKDSTPKLQ